ncbi:hypothetical protein MS3_00005167 [Schistosoma haematobium]|uniref:Uncharacterized protein n=1 Tax=Schistosoma haematobium TaxID=6185 RepID=A0A922ITW1_SCHHA|nr:hypothetical protein MS3_00005167 [Schistosoma haematobium]KAH9587425.1 hypothetical protein MS3_00005167 [Schistosoma haematobium]CAH8546379.1 unnamed protein product [Schistosoma haematobium]
MQKSSHMSGRSRSWRRIGASLPILEALTQMSQSITVPVTFIRSFKYRTTCYLPLSNIPQSATVKDLFDRIHHEVKISSVIPSPFKNLCYDALKVRHKAFNTKSGELLIDLEGDPIPSNSDLTLESLGIVNETEVAVFKMSDFLAQRDNPEFLW